MSRPEGLLFSRPLGIDVGGIGNRDIFEHPNTTAPLSENPILQKQNIVTAAEIDASVVENATPNNPDYEEMLQAYNKTEQELTEQGNILEVFGTRIFSPAPTPGDKF